MPPRLPRLAIGFLRLPLSTQGQQICLFCSLSPYFSYAAPIRRSRVPQLKQHRIQARQQSTLGSALISDREVTSTLKKPRIDLRDALLDLKKHAGSYVNISRLQLALRGLEQIPGQETIRIAILGVADGGVSLKTAKQLLRSIVADPLKDEEEWERILLGNGPNSRPLLLNIGGGTAEPGQNSMLVEVLQVSSPTLNGHRLEILVLEMDPPDAAGGDREFENAALVPTMEIPTSSTGRYTPVTTPVHKVLLVADGIMGAATLASYPIDLDRNVIRAAVDLQIPDDDTDLPFDVVDVGKGAKALDLFRQSVDNSLEYERNWSASGLPAISAWLKSGSSPTQGTMKPPLRSLIDSVLRDASLAIQAEQSRRLNTALLSKVSSAKLDSLRIGLSQWADRAHIELRDQLDIAFGGQRWKKLGWWKLFWRVDDVSMIASDILSTRFLAEAEKEIIFLSGRIDESGILKDVLLTPDQNWAYKPVAEEPVESGPPPPTIQGVMGTPKDDLPAKSQPKPWPLHIPATRTFLSMETIPALQALGQKLVLQTLTTSTFTSLLAGLMYVSSISTSVYEAGAVAALGIVWSLKRMQGKWETARRFWEGEVREEGRKAVRGVEGAVGNVLTQPNKPLKGDEEFDEANDYIRKAETAFKACK
jgi:hypothetical protein